MVALTAGEAALLHRSRRAVLGTAAPDGRPRLVPMVFAALRANDGELVLYSALDEKPKAVSDPHRLARVRDVLERPEVSFLVDEWDEDWTQLCWLRLDGRATVLEPVGEAAVEHQTALRLLRDRYMQYATQRLEERPVLRIEIERSASWGIDE